MFKWANILAIVGRMAGAIASEMGATVPTNPTTGGVSATAAANAVKGAVTKALEANNGVLTEGVAAAGEAAVSAIPGGAPFSGFAGAILSDLAAKGLATYEAHNQGLTNAAA